MTTQPMEALKPWRYQINYGPNNEDDFANVYNDKGEMVGNLRTQHAMRIVEGMNTRPATDGQREDIEKAFRLLQKVGGTREVLEAAVLLARVLAATPQAEAAPPVLPSDEQPLLQKMWAYLEEMSHETAKVYENGKLLGEKATGRAHYFGELMHKFSNEYRAATAHQNAGDGWDMKAVKLVGAISALKGYTTTTGPGTPDYFQRLRDHYIAELEKAAAAFLPPLPTPPRNGRVG